MGSSTDVALHVWAFGTLKRFQACEINIICMVMTEGVVGFLSQEHGLPSKSSCLRCNWPVQGDIQRGERLASGHPERQVPSQKPRNRCHRPRSWIWSHGYTSGTTGLQVKAITIDTRYCRTRHVHEVVIPQSRGQAVHSTVSSKNTVTKTKQRPTQSRCARIGGVLDLPRTQSPGLSIISRAG